MRRPLPRSLQLLVNSYMLSHCLRRPAVRFLFAALCLLPLARLNASTRLYLSIDKIPGESVDKGYEKKIDLYSFSWGSMNTGTARTGGNTTTSKPELSDLVIMKKLDVSSPA